MRCPKCGFISFDHLEQCIKCKKNIKAVSDTLHGTVFHVAAPVFLQLSRKRDEEAEDDREFADDLEADEEFVDDDLEVLVDEGASTVVDDGRAAEGFDTGGRRITGKTMADSEESEGREIEIDLSQFEDAEELEGEPEDTKNILNESVAQSLSLELPAELSDISDLSPPGRGVQAEKPTSKNIAKKDASSLEINDLDFDLGLGDFNAELVGGSDPTKETMLALEDIDFSETLTKSSAKHVRKHSGADMDEELNFNLDLGGLSIHKDL